MTQELPPSEPKTGKLMEIFQRIKQSTPRGVVPVSIVVLAVFLVFLYVTNWNVWDGGRAVEVTDDAYVRGEVRPLSTKVSGVVVSVPVTDFQRVKAGDVIAQLRNDDFQARVDEAEASVDQIQKSVEELKQEEKVQDARIDAAQSALAVSKTGVDQARNNSQIGRAQIEIAVVGVKQTTEDIASTDAIIRGDRAKAMRASLEQTRQHSLYSERATTQREVEQIDSDATDANEAIKRDTARKNALQHSLNGHNSDLEKAKQQLSNDVYDETNAANQFLRAKSNLEEQLRQKEVLISREKILAAELKAKQSTLKTAQVEMDYTFIRAPIDGIISDRKVFPGQLVSAGTSAATIVSATPWVVASYRETQLSKVFVGNRAEVTVDGLPGVTFKGTVNAISPASEAQYALLPPDNASGNFTKITQRVPVKITFAPDQKDLDRMRPGMSVLAHVWTSSPH